jgi:transcriptional regulator with XRE-family HTH domain
MTTKTVPNTALRAWRVSRRLSQDGMARAVQEAGARIGEPNDASKRLIQRWETGETRQCRNAYAKALEAMTGLPIEMLGFAVRVEPDGRGGHDVARESAPDGQDNGSREATPRGDEPRPAIDTPAVPGAYNGVWLSRYQYFSSGRDETFEALHYVVVLQHDSRLTVRSLPGASSNPDSNLSMDLGIEGNVVTGTWREETSREGHYRGAVYHGAIQMLVEPTGHRIAGKWVGFGRNMDVNSGPWELVLQDDGTSQSTIRSYSRPPEA